jgi:hypothetical protein
MPRSNRTTPEFQDRRFAMTRFKKRILIAGAAVILVLPAATFADIVFDPTNFAEAVLQVADDVQMVDQLYQEVTNEVAIRHRVGDSRLGRVVVRVESPDRPLLDAPIQPREADSLGAGGRLLDHRAQAMPRWFAGHENCRSSRCLVDLVCHKAPPEKEENSKPGWLRPTKAQAIF